MSEPGLGRRFGGRRLDRRSWLAMLAIAVIAVIAVVAGYLFSQGQLPGQQRQPGVVAEFSGEGDVTTDAFAVEEGWEIRWQTQGSRFEMALRQGDSSRTLMSREGPGSGTTVPRGSGSYQLVITAEGPWTVQVRQP